MLAGARVTVFAVDPASGARRGEAAHQQTVGADGRWGPFSAQPTARYEFVLDVPGQGTTHIYRSPFVRSSGFVNLRTERLAPAAMRSRELDCPAPWAGTPQRTVSAEFNGERLTGQSWPAAQGHATVLELTY